MKKLFFEIEQDGFYGTYYENPKGADLMKYRSYHNRKTVKLHNIRYVLGHLPYF